MELEFRLNGVDVEMEISATTFLVDAVRNRGLTGTKEGCGVGVCGACTVLVDDQPVSSCLYLAACAEGADVWTIEGLIDRFPTVAESFVTEEAMQCGICTPGHVVAVCALRLQKAPANEENIRTLLNGNLCRCTGYRTILSAAKAAIVND